MPNKRQCCKWVYLTVLNFQIYFLLYCFHERNNYTQTLKQTFWHFCSNLWWNYCKTLIIRVTLLWRDHQLGYTHRTSFSRFCLILLYIPYIRNYWRGLIIRVSVLSRIHVKIKSSRIKSVLQYLILCKRHSTISSVEAQSLSWLRLEQLGDKMFVIKWFAGINCIILRLQIKFYHDASVEQ